MKLTTLAQGASWMTGAETVLNRKFVRGLRRLLRAWGVAENPLLVLRVNDVAVSWLVARRLEAGLAPADADLECARVTPVQADAIGKSRERLRKAVKELEDYCARAGTPVDSGLADHLQSVVRKVQGQGPSFIPQ